MACWIVFDHYFIITQSNSTIILFLHCLNETIMSTHSTSDIAHINMPPNNDENLFCDLHQTTTVSLNTSNGGAAHTYIPPNTEGIFVATDNAIVKHVLDRITIVVRVVLILHTRCFVLWDAEMENCSFNEF